MMNTMGDLQQKINSFVKVHTLPNVLNVLITELGSDKATPTSIAKIISKDISLTARLLRVANSAFYRRQSEISTIDMAISVLGIRAVKALALSVSMFELTETASNNLVNLNQFWYHSLEIAVTARRLAEHTRDVQPEEAFVCGLIHDLGILFFVQEFPEKYQKVNALIKQGKSYEEAEIEVIGMSHSDAGARIATAWHLPMIFQESLAYHHKHHFLTEENHIPQVWEIVNLAHRFCRKGIDVPPDVTAGIIEARHKLAQALGIEAGIVSKILSEVPNLVLSAASFLDVNIGDPLTILKNVNEELGKIYEEYESAIVDNDSMQRRFLEQEKDKAALEALRTTLATFSHYVNNATATIVGRAQILDLYLNQGKLEDPDGKIQQSVKIISESVDTICAVLDELKELPEFKTVAYHGSSRILDIDENIKARLGRLA